MTELPGGTFTIPEDGPARLDAIVGGDAGPLWAFMAATNGIGMTIEELFASLGSSIQDGPMLGEWAVEFDEPLEPGREYRVSGEILGSERKTGRSGSFDLVRMDVVLEGAARCEFTYVVPR